MFLRIFGLAIWRIVSQPIRVAQFFGAALAFMLVAQIALGPQAIVSPNSLVMQVLWGRMPAFRTILLSLLLLALWLWGVVGWHRYILLKEKPALVPIPNAERMLGYLGKSFLCYVVISVGVYLVINIPGRIIYRAMDEFAVRAGVTNFWLPGMILLVAALIPLCYVTLRLALVLPGVALRPAIPLFSGWTASAGRSSTIFGVAVLCIVLTMGISYFGALMLLKLVLQVPHQAQSWLQLIPVFLNWAFSVVAVSLLTQLYDYYLGREAAE